MRPFLVALLALAATGAAAEPAAGQALLQVPAPLVASHAAAADSAREQVRAWMAEKNLPGVSVAVGVNGRVVWAEGFGWADLEHRVAVTPLTRFRVGSIAKPFTSAAVGLLHERGALDLDAPVQTYVEAFPPKRWPVSTRQLMGHVAGIRHYRGDEFLSADRYGGVVEALAIFASDTLEFRPGTKFGYSTYGWNLVSAVVESAAGEPFLDFMRREVFAALAMRHTVPDDVTGIVPDRAGFYVRDSAGRLVNAPYVDQSNKWAGGGFLSTPSDLVRFGFAMMDGELLDSATVALLWTPLRLESGEPTSYGLGWAVGTAPDEYGRLAGRRLVSHTGGSIGGTTLFLLFPDDRMVVAVTSNLSSAEVGRIGSIVTRLFAAQP